MNQMQINGKGKDIFSPNIIHEGQSVNAQLIRIRLLELIDGKHGLSDNHFEQLKTNLKQLLENLSRAYNNSIRDMAVSQGYYTAVRQTEPTKKYLTENHQKDHLFSFYQLLVQVGLWLENNTEPYPLNANDHRKIIDLLSNIEKAEQSLVTTTGHCF